MVIYQTITKYIVPFAFQIKQSEMNSFQSIINKFNRIHSEDSKGIWSFREFNIEYSRFNSHISDLICGFSDGCCKQVYAAEKIQDKMVGVALSLNKDAEVDGFKERRWATRYSFNFPERDQKDKGGQLVEAGIIDLMLEQVELYLFRTGVGFFVVSSQLDTKNIEEYISFNRRFRSIDNSGGEDRCISGTSYRMDHLLKDLFTFATSELKGISYYENNEKTEDRAALIYSAMYMNTEECPDMKEIKRLLYAACRGYDPRYHDLSQELINRIPDMEYYAAFGNSIWASSLEGIANIVWDNKSAENSAFFSNQYFGRDEEGRKRGNLNNGYFFMYIVALHQRYALLNLFKKASSVPNSLHEMIEKKNGKSIMLELIENMSIFKVKYRYKTISAITHYNKLYDLICDSLRIEEMLNELDSEIQGLQSLIQITNENASKNRSHRIRQLSWIFGIFAATSQAISISEGFNMIKPSLIEHQRDIFIGSLGVSVLMWAIGVYFFIQKDKVQ